MQKTGNKGFKIGLDAIRPVRVEGTRKFFDFSFFFNGFPIEKFRYLGAKLAKDPKFLGANPAF